MKKTKNILNKVVAISLGTLSGIAVLFIIETIGHLIAPPPLNIDFNDIDAIKNYTKNAPVIVFLMLILAYALGSFVGGYIAGKLSKEKKTDNALSVGGILLGLGTFNLFSLPHPTWVIVLGLIVFIPFALFGGKLAEKRKAKNKEE